MKEAPTKYTANNFSIHENETKQPLLYVGEMDGGMNMGGDT